MTNRANLSNGLSLLSKKTELPTHGGKILEDKFQYMQLVIMKKKMILIKNTKINWCEVELYHSASGLWVGVEGERERGKGKKRGGGIMTNSMCQSQIDTVRLYLLTGHQEKRWVDFNDHGFSQFHQYGFVLHG